jgi:alkyl sulfatase BDS1-like metallo-beta-lactamase superfamily hydrolase
VPDVGDPNLGNADFLKAVPSLDLFDALAVRYNPAEMNQDPFSIVFNFPDRNETISLLVEEAVIVPRDGTIEDAAATVTMNRSDFDRLILREAAPLGLITGGKMKISGKRSAVSAMFDALDQPDFWFNTVEP